MACRVTKDYRCLLFFLFPRFFLLVFLLLFGEQLLLLGLFAIPVYVLLMCC
jgi:hypothetical protein